MVPFGDPNATLAGTRYNNDRIQEIINAMRPYGGTPIDGVMDDAYVYFSDDTATHPDGGYPFAPHTDPFVQDGCRENFILLLSDGEPNLDMRPYCDQTGTPNGLCPYQRRGYERARDLYTASPSIRTFTIGFGLSSGTGFDCTTINPAIDFTGVGKCVNPPAGLDACCNLSRIAFEGGTGNALFADNPTQLRNAIAAVLDAVSTQNTSRTRPVFASAASTVAGQSNAPAVSYEFGSSFTPDQGELWDGQLERKRWECVDVSGVLQPQLQAVDDTKGDDFAANVNQGKLVTPRRFITVIPALSAAARHGDQNIRPNLLVDDGMGIYGGDTKDGDLAFMANEAQAAPLALGIPAAPLPSVCTGPDIGVATNSDCAHALMNWNLGGNNGAGLPTRDGDEFGAIYHSTPALHDRPTAFTRDPAYERFADAQADRPFMLYTGTVDGQLHGFKVAANSTSDGLQVDALDNNELWSFIPPYVLPRIVSQFPGTPTILLDGQAVVKDLPFERTLGQAVAGGFVGGADWRSVLVGGGFLGGGYYYALDVTDPDNPSFLWQLAADTIGEQMFGDVSGNPAIATIALNEGAGVKEVAVAILPGGQGTACVGTTPRQNTSFGHILGYRGTSISVNPSSQAGCWTQNATQSITIVKLETGEVIRSFRGHLNAGPASLDGGRVIAAPFDAPMIEVVPFPNNTGQVANRVYAADQDGTLWRLNLADPNPNNWEAHLFFDSYPSSPSVATNRAPLPAKPVIAVDGLGNTVVIWSTGDNEDFTSNTVDGTIWSVTETPRQAVNGFPFIVEANWTMSENTIPPTNLNAGERAVGPVAVFDQVAYFATFSPPSGANACDLGSSRIWGVSFQENGSSAIPEPLPRIPDGANSFKYNPDDTDSPDLANDPTIFGVAVAAEPTCTQEVSVTDDYVGTHTTLQQAVPPTFKLRFHTGIEGQADVGSSIRAGTLAVSQPRIQSRIDSWASVVE